MTRLERGVDRLDRLLPATLPVVDVDVAREAFLARMEAATHRTISRTATEAHSKGFDTLAHELASSLGLSLGEFTAVMRRRARQQTLEARDIHRFLLHNWTGHCKPAKDERSDCELWAIRNGYGPPEDRGEAPSEAAHAALVEVWTARYTTEGHPPETAKAMAETAAGALADPQAPVERIPR